MSPASLIWSRSPFHLYQYPTPPERSGKSFSMDLNLYFCRGCHHGHLHPLPDDSVMEEFYSSEYGSYTSPLQTGGLTGSLNEPAVKFVSDEISRIWGSKKVRIADVGGNDGSVLSRLQPRGSELLLIDPSESACEIAGRMNIPLRQAFLDEQLAGELAGRFDVVISRHVIEHIREPEAFVKDLTTLLSPEGLLVIETPDMEGILRSLLVRTVMLQHIHYFSPRSLGNLVQSHAAIQATAPVLEYAFLLSARNSESGAPSSLPSLDSDAPAAAKAFEQGVQGHRDRLSALSEEWVRQKKRIWAWGAGSVAGELFSLYGQESSHFQGFIDSDPRKAKMRFANVPDLPICTPDQAYARGVDAVLITSFSVAEIRKTIQDRGGSVEVADIYSGKRIS